MERNDVCLGCDGKPSQSPDGDSSPRGGAKMLKRARTDQQHARVVWFVVQLNREKGQGMKSLARVQGRVAPAGIGKGRALARQ